jgi:hypothetical protein
MKRQLFRLGAALTLVLLLFTATWRNGQRRLARLVQEFEEYSGTRLVFDRRRLPPGQYHDKMPPLPRGRRAPAAAICLREARKYPPGYLGRAGLEAIGVFAACVGKRGDGYRPYNAALGGYRYYGIWNQANACAAAYYTDHQLALTFHHEVFHHIDAAAERAAGGDPDRDGDRRYREALAGGAPYPTPAIRPTDLAAVKQVSQGDVLEGAVGEYAERAIGEDHAETARYLMTTLADALVQVVERPDLPGSQRILYCLQRYGGAVEDAPGIDWFVDVALGRTAASTENWFPD